MRRLPLGWLLPLLLLASAVAGAHPMPSTAVLLRFAPRAVEVELDIPVIELQLGWDRPIPDDPVALARDHATPLRAYIAEHLHAETPGGQPWTVEVGEVSPIAAQTDDVRVAARMIPPVGAPSDRFTLAYDAVLHRLITHSAIVLVRSDWRNGVVGETPTPLATIDYRHTRLRIDRSRGSWWRGFAGIFGLGARHIAQGTDHLLFLLALLLPAPLLALGGRWSGFAGGKVAFRRIAGIASAFTVGHSITLVLGALGLAHLPDRLVESAIALSIVVSAVHALVPILRGKEVLIAAAFGLVHGLAFAQTLADFQFDTATLVSGVLGFNLGIEAFQLVVIAITMPWLVLLARTRLYGPLRIVGACLTLIAASGWLLERAFGGTNLVGPVVERVAANGLWIVLALAAVALLSYRFVPSAPRGEDVRARS